MNKSIMNEIYLWGTKVEFLCKGMGTPEAGYIVVVDPHGTFVPVNEETSYDINVPGKGTYKHILHRQILRNLPQDNEARGRLQKGDMENSYHVAMSLNGYYAVIDKSLPIEVKLPWEKQWVQACSFNYEEYLGCPVEFRYGEMKLQVGYLLDAFQDETDLICEVFRCEDNVVLMDGGYYPWRQENLILRGGKASVGFEYRYENVYRWDIIDGVLKICLGRVPDPSKRVLEYAVEWLEKHSDRTGG